MLTYAGSVDPHGCLKPRGVHDRLTQCQLLLMKAVPTMTAFLLKSTVSASVHRAAIGKRSHLREKLLMGGCAAAAFLFVGLFVVGVF